MSRLSGAVNALAAVRWVCLGMILGAGFCRAYDVVGRVVADHSGEGLRSVELRVVQVGSQRLVAELESASDGGFRAEHLEAGEYEIWLAKPNYLTTILRLRIPFRTPVRAGRASTEASDSAAPASSVIRLVRYGALSGQVVSAQGEPIRDGSVCVFRAANGSLRLFAGPAFLDRQGRYRVHGLPLGEYSVGLVYGRSAVSGEGGFLMYGQPDLLTVSGGEEYRGVNFVLIPNSPCELSGIVQLPEPGQGFAVALVPAAAPSVSVARQQTDPEGRFHFGAVACGSYDLLVAGPVYAWGEPTALLGREPLFGRVHMSLVAKSATDVFIPVRAGPRLPLLLRGESRPRAPTPCSQTAEVLLSPVDAWGAALERRVRLAVGIRQLVDNLAPGHYFLEMPPPGADCYGQAPPIVDPTSRSSEDPVPVSAVGPGWIRGKLIAVSEPADTFVVALMDSDPIAGGQTLRLAYVAPDSAFEFRALRPGRYLITAHSALNGQARWLRNVRQMMEVEVRGGSATDVELVF